MSDPYLTPRRPGDRPALVLGAMNFGRRTPEPEALRIIDRACDAGITLIDTANAYTGGESERIVGKALAGRRARFRVATKAGWRRDDAGRQEGLSRGALVRAIDESLQRLNTDYVDVFYLHVPDSQTPLQESIAAAQDIVQSGKSRAFGISNFASWQILQMMHLCDARVGPRPVISQQLYNLLVRQLDIEYFRFTAAHPIHTTVYNPLAGGVLSGRYAHADSVQPGSRFDGNPLYQLRYWSQVMLERAAALGALARSQGMSLVDLSYAWLAHRPGVDSILVGPGSVQHLEAALRAVHLALAPETLERIDALYRGWMGTDASYAR